MPQGFLGAAGRQDAIAGPLQHLKRNLAHNRFVLHQQNNWRRDCPFRIAGKHRLDRRKFHSSPCQPWVVINGSGHDQEVQACYQLGSNSENSTKGSAVFKMRMKSENMDVLRPSPNQDDSSFGSRISGTGRQSFRLRFVRVVRFSVQLLRRVECYRGRRVRRRLATICGRLPSLLPAQCPDCAS